jgi:hypothetical protein
MEVTRYSLSRVQFVTHKTNFDAQTKSFVQLRGTLLKGVQKDCGEPASAGACHPGVARYTAGRHRHLLLAAVDLVVSSQLTPTPILGGII